MLSLSTNITPLIQAMFKLQMPAAQMS
jgi:hypothetical protein